MTIKNPIITVAGHVDHGKTTILDAIRGSSVAEQEAGGITQKISFTLFPADMIRNRYPIIDKYKIKLDIPGFLFIDTPGHAAFTNLRKRGGSLADLAIVVIDINEGIKPQTAEVLRIMKSNKTPFVVALNKIDNISGWRKIRGVRVDPYQPKHRVSPLSTPSRALSTPDDELNENLKQSIESQAAIAKQTFDERLFMLIGALHNYGFEAELFYNIKDFTKKLALVPCSAKTREGIQELVMVLCGLCQKFLKERLTLGKEARGVILEIKKEKMLSYIEAILYDGKLKRNDIIAVATFDEPIISKVRTLEKIAPLSAKFQPVEEIEAANGIRMQLTEMNGIMPGLPFVIYKNNIEEIKKAFKKELTENIVLDKKGIIVKADSLGSLEAVLNILRSEGINVIRAGIGKINKDDISVAKASKKLDVLDGLVVGFNITPEEDIIENDVSIFCEDVIYKLVDKIKEWKEAKKAEIEREELMKIGTIAKLEILHQHVFRNSNPAVFGVRVYGKARAGISLIDEAGNEVGKIKAMQMQNESIKEATSGSEVAISIPGIAFDRRLKENRFLYSDVSEARFRELKKKKEILGSAEISILQEIAAIHRKKKATWGV
ncbi:GTP-binding protein [Candidatus Pacearchaeota archaeon]|nr:GTP-binding protein [Candidatus Pacearchaeota archaeon]